MFNHLAYALVAFSGFGAPVPSEDIHHKSSISHACPRLPWMHQTNDFPEAENSGDVADPLPQVVRQRMEEAAGDSPVHHQAREQQHGMIVYTAHFTDAASGIEQRITVAPDGHILFLEPVLLTAPRSNQVHERVQNANMIPDIPDLMTAKPADLTFDAPRADRLKVSDAPHDDQGRDAAPASRVGRPQDPH